MITGILQFSNLALNFSRVRLSPEMRGMLSLSSHSLRTAVLAHSQGWYRRSLQTALSKQAWLLQLW